MKNNTLASLCLAVLILTSGIVWAQTSPAPKPVATDTRVEKLIEQNQQILKNQEEILKRLERIEQGLTQLRRRSG